MMMTAEEIVRLFAEQPQPHPKILIEAVAVAFVKVSHG
jgi:hypothetical protein